MGTIGPNTNVDAGMLRADCVLLIGEDARWCETMLRERFGEVEAAHEFRGYVFQRRAQVTTIFSGMGTGCTAALVWEMAEVTWLRRLVLVGTAGLMPGAALAYGRAHVMERARAAASGLDAIGLCATYGPRWNGGNACPSASVVSTDFYYGFGEAVRSDAHPLAMTRLRDLFEGSGEELVDMEVAAFYAMCTARMPAAVEYVAVKAAANPAGEGAEHLANTEKALRACVEMAEKLLA